MTTTGLKPTTTAATSAAGVGYDEKRGTYVGLAHGSKFYMGDVASNKLIPDEWIHHMRGIIRFSGGSGIDVWTHTINVVRYMEHTRCSMAEQRKGLVHDMKEVIIGDDTRPLKQFLGEGRESKREQLGHEVNAWIHHELFRDTHGVRDYDGYDTEAVRHADNVILRIEMEAYVPRMPRPDTLPYPDAEFEYLGPTHSDIGAAQREMWDRLLRTDNHG